MLYAAGATGSDSTVTTPADAPRCGGVGPSSQLQRLRCRPHSGAKHMSKPIRSPVSVTANLHHSSLTFI